jgi:hypothetical protein
MGKKFEWKEFAKKYARRRHALQATVVDNCCVYYEISEENRGEEFRHNDFEIQMLRICIVCIMQS